MVQRSPSIIIVTYNSAEFIGSCLDSLRRHAPAAEVVVVDNASNDESAGIAATFPEVHVVRNSRNEGFAAATNEGVRQSAGDPVFLLNPDAEIQAGFVERLGAVVEDPGVAVAGCKILDPDGKTLQHAGGQIHGNALTDHLGRGEPDEGQYDRVSDVAYVTGAALAVRRRVWNEVGGLDPGYHPAYFEEVELCWQARARGYRVVVVGDVAVLHQEGGSSAGDGDLHASAPPSYLRMYHRNRVRFVLRNFPVRQLLTQYARAEARWLLKVRPRGQVGAVARAYLRALLELPWIVRFRCRQKWGAGGGPGEEREEVLGV